MNYGFVKVAAAVPQVKVADCFYNIQQIEGLMRQASQKEVQIIAFPELSVTSYTCMDLFSQETLLRNAEKALLDLVNNTRRSGFTNDRRLPACQREPTDKRRRRFPTGRDIGGSAQKLPAQLQGVPRRALVHGLFTPTAIHDHDR